VLETIRVLLLAILFLGMIAAGVELYLLEHTEDAPQLAPFIALALGCAGGLLIAVRPSRTSLLLFRAIMGILVVVGVAGIYYHYGGNVEFELEMYPALEGWELIWNSLKGATPVGAPGYLTWLGLLGLAYTYAHRLLERRPPAGDRRTEEA